MTIMTKPETNVRALSLETREELAKVELARRQVERGEVRSLEEVEALFEKRYGVRV